MFVYVDVCLLLCVFDFVAYSISRENDVGGYIAIFKYMVKKDLYVCLCELIKCWVS